MEAKNTPRADPTIGKANFTLKSGLKLNKMGTKMKVNLYSRYLEAVEM